MKKDDLAKMPYGEVIGLVTLFRESGLIDTDPKPSPSEKNIYYKVGENIFIRTVTHIDVGRLVAVYDNEIVIENASWIPDTGRFSDALKDFSKISEVEPYPDNTPVIIGRGAIIEAHMTSQKLPTEQK